MIKHLALGKSIPIKQGNLIDIYRREICKNKRITPEEEAELAFRIKDGDNEALQSLVSANLLFVFAVAKQFQGQGLDLTDLINEGNLGLIKAAETFDPKRGFKFISYTIWQIRYEIMEAIALKNKIVPTPLGYRIRIKKILKIQDKYLNEKGIYPTINEIALETGISEDKIKMALSFNYDSDLSLDRNFYEGNNNTLLDIINNNDSIKPDKFVLDESLRFEIQKLLSTLKPQEEIVLKMHFGIDYSPMSAWEIAEELGVKRTRVLQIICETLKKIKENPSSTKVLKGYYVDLN